MKIRFAEMVDIQQIKRLLDSFCDMTGAAANIIDNERSFLVEAGWTGICADFHRSYPETKKNCYASVKGFLDNNIAYPYLVNKCINGLNSCACPIIVNGQALAIMVVTQVLVEPPDVEFFRKQARKYGFDEQAYIDALGNVKIITEEKLVQVTKFYAEMITALVDAGVRQLQHLETIALLDKREEALRKSEATYRSLIDNMKIGVCRSNDDEQGRFIQANPALANIFGYDSAEKIMKVSIVDLYQSAEERKKFMDELKRNRAVKNLESVFRKKDGTSIWCSVTAAVQYDENDNIKWFDAVVEDITERKQVETALFNSRQMLRLVFDTIPQRIYWKDLNSVYIGCNKQFALDCGYAEPRELIGKTDYEMPAVQKAESCRADDKLVIETGASKQNYEEIRNKADGTEIWTINNKMPLYNKEGCIIGVLGIYEDITERKRIEELLKESENRLRDFVQAVPDMSLIIDEDGRYVEVFGSSEALWPIPPEKMRGRTVNEMFPPDEAKGYMAEIQVALTTQLTRRYEHIVEPPSGQRIIEARMAPMNYVVNGKKTVAVVIVDVTERRRAERLLQLTYQIQRRSDFFNDIISESAAIDSKSKDVASCFGIDLSKPLVCMLINSDYFADRVESQLVKNSLIDLVSDSKGNIVWDCRSEIGVLCQVSDLDGDDKKLGLQIARQIKEKIYNYNPEIEIIIGIGNRQNGLSGVRKSYQQAWNAIISMQCQGEACEGIYHYQDVGILQILAAYGEQEHADEFVQSKIGRLIAYDREKGTDLVDTLEKILQSANLKEAADVMYIHHKTMVFRKKRIETILNESIEGFETRLSLVAAIKLYKLCKLINRN